MITDPATTIAPDPKSSHVPGSAVDEVVTVTTSVSFSATCPGCGARHRRDDRDGAISAAAACLHGAS